MDVAIPIMVCFGFSRYDRCISTFQKRRTHIVLHYVMRSAAQVINHWPMGEASYHCIIINKRIDVIDAKGESSAIIMEDERHFNG